MPRMGRLVDLSVVFPLLEEKLRVVQLSGGPCAGRHAEVAGHAAECWQRVGPPGGVGVETQMWSRYDLAPLSGEFVYSGITVTTDELQAGLEAAKEAGHTYGESYGA